MLLLLYEPVCPAGSSLDHVDVFRTLVTSAFWMNFFCCSFICFCCMVIFVNLENGREIFAKIWQDRILHRDHTPPHTQTALLHLTRWLLSVFHIPCHGYGELRCSLLYSHYVLRLFGFDLLLSVVYFDLLLPIVYFDLLLPLVYLTILLTISVGLIPIGFRQLLPLLRRTSAFLLLTKYRLRIEHKR